MFKVNFKFYQNVVVFVINLATKFSRPISMLGLFLIVIMVIQCLSGIMLSFSLLGEPMLVPMSRSEEDMDDLFTDDFFWLHERGVDLIFITLYLHFLRKFYLNSYSKEQEIAWKSGAFAFLLTHGVIFFGLVLCTTHLSDVTLKIAANIMLTFVKKKINIHWWLFTDKALNTDSLIRMMYAHYCLAFLLLYVSICHALAMHYDWKDSQINNNMEIRLKWFYDLFRTEIGSLIQFLLYFICISKYLYTDTEPLNNELFTFGDVGILLDVRFLGVMPHWYFRGYMGWLILVPQHYIGIFGLIIFMVIIYFQPNLKKKYFKIFDKKIKPTNISNISLLMMWIYVISLFFCDSLLPYGRFFSRVGGHKSLTVSYFIVFIYLIIPTKYIIFTKIQIIGKYTQEEETWPKWLVDLSKQFNHFLGKLNIIKYNFNIKYNYWFQNKLTKQQQNIVLFFINIFEETIGVMLFLIKIQLTVFKNILFNLPYIKIFSYILNKISRFLNKLEELYYTLRDIIWDIEYFIKTFNLFTTINYIKTFCKNIFTKIKKFQLNNYKNYPFEKIEILKNFFLKKINTIKRLSKSLKDLAEGNIKNNI